jgi:hypothetical protein
MTKDLVALVERQQQIIENASAAAMWQARAEKLAGELADARGQLKALQAPREEPTPEKGDGRSNAAHSRAATAALVVSLAGVLG